MNEQPTKSSGMASPNAIHRWGRAKTEPKFRHVENSDRIELMKSPHTQYKFDHVKRVWRAVRKVG